MTRHGLSAAVIIGTLLASVAVVGESEAGIQGSSGSESPQGSSDRRWRRQSSDPTPALDSSEEEELTTPAQLDKYLAEIHATDPASNGTGTMLAKVTMQPGVWRQDECSEGLVPWIRDILNRTLKQYAETPEAARDRCARARAPGWTLGAQLAPPDDAGSAVEVLRVHVDDLSAADFYTHFIRPGVPLVLRGGDGDGRAPWEARRAALRRSRRADLDDLDCVPSAAGEASCASNGVRLTPPSKVNIPGKAALGALSIFNFSTAVPTHAPAERHLLRGPIFSGVAGETFGRFDHFDQHCGGSLSVQYEGVKRWTLWSPWDLLDADGVTLLPASTRFETVLGPTDILYWPPAYFHRTKVLEGTSIAAVNNFAEPPAYGGQRAHAPWTNSPFGYADCARGRNGWMQRARAWDYRLGIKDSTTAGAPAARDEGAAKQGVDPTPWAKKEL